MKINKKKIISLIRESIENYISGAQCGLLNLYHVVEDDQIELALYKINEMFQLGSQDSIDIVAYFRLEPTFGPCIDNSQFDTWQISSIHTDENYRKCGYGMLIYDLAFYIAQNEGHTLTSDKLNGSKADAYDIWQKILSSPDYVYKTTFQGNSKLDFNNLTQDPDDDCEDDAQKAGINAADYVVIKMNTNVTAPYFDYMKNRHDLHMDDLRNNLRSKEVNDFLDYIFIQADISFNLAFKNSGYK